VVALEGGMDWREKPMPVERKLGGVPPIQGRLGEHMGGSPRELGKEPRHPCRPSDARVLFPAQRPLRGEILRRRAQLGCSGTRADCRAAMQPLEFAWALWWRRAKEGEERTS
jgi:hypothetical protein